MMKRLISILMTALLLCSLLGSAQAQTRTNGSQFYNRMADDPTLDSWKQLFGPGVDNTANVGTVWTDKTVTKAVPSDDEGTYNFTMENSDANFMVTLSTLSATMSITGHETLPTDTVFVLDLSSSMYRNINGSNYSTAHVGPMVTAVNDAIHRLLNLNPLNRVGVVIYYGDCFITPQSNDTHYVPLLKLASFAPHTNEDGDPDYLIMNAPNNNLAGISVNPALNATTVPYVMPNHPVYENVAGTYMQLGIKKALDMMLSDDPKVPSDSQFQAGATRIPIMVLMSDGEPTAAHYNFSTLQTSDSHYAIMGNNATAERSPAESDFLTQLTAAMARELLDMHYAETKPLFYTLGLGQDDQLSFDVMDPYYNDMTTSANEIKALSEAYTYATGRAGDPQDYQNDKKAVNARIKTYWDDFVHNRELKLRYCFYNGEWRNFPTTPALQKVSSYTVGNKTFTFSYPFPSSLSQKYYVDKFFQADTASQLTSAFDSLVDEIELQSAYYPTYVKNGAIGMSGYVDFHDELGDMMEVKAVHGLARRATSREIANINALPESERNKINIVDNVIYYKGEQIAEYFQKHMYPASKNAQDKAEITNVLTQLFKVRLGLTESDAQSLLNAIIEEKAIYWESNTKFSNSFSWYADANEAFIALDVGQNIPANAAYRITSYWYASPYDLENTNSFIRVKTALGGMRKQCVTWSVPASMIPLVKYAATLEHDSLQNPGTITVDYKDNYPIRAFFEVGLRSDITKYNAVQVLKDAGYGLNDGVLFNEETGEYHFFSNKFDTTKTDPALTQLHTAGNTVTTFRPSEENERYFITTDSKVKDGKVDLPVFQLLQNKSWSETNNASLNWVEIPVSADDGTYVPAHTPRYPDGRDIKKESNTTNSFPSSTLETSHEQGETYIISILGNNGTFHFTADTGIAITKKIDRADLTDADKQTEFTFVIAPAADNANVLNGSYDVEYVAANGAVTKTTVDAIDNTITLKIKHGEMAYLAGNCLSSNCRIPEGNYTITEQIVGEDGKYFYEVKDVTVTIPGAEPTSMGETTQVTVAVETNQVTQVDYTNEPVTTGSIQITKAVTSDEGITAPQNAVFTFEVLLVANHHPVGSTVKVNGIDTEVGEGGKLTVTMTADQTVTISGLAAEESAQVTVTEITPPAGFSVVGDAEMTKTVVSNETVVFPFSNKYEVESTAFYFSGTKSLSGRSMVEGEFTFTLYAADEAYTPGAVLQTTRNTANGAFAFAPIPYDAVGIYYYVVCEEQGTLANMTYDATEYRIQVIVSGTAEAQLVAAVNVSTKNPLPEGMEAPTANTLAFHNAHDEADAAVVFSGIKTYAGHSLSHGDFTFTLYSADGSFTPVAPVQTVTHQADGSFAFRPIVFNQVGTYRYVVHEDQVGKSYVTYDGAEYRILVEVWNNNGVLVANVTANRVANGEMTSVNALGGLTFTNHYIPASVTVPFSGLKVYQGAELQSGMFTFHLYAADANFLPVGAPLDSAVNALDGSFAFSKRAFHSAGVYRFLVVEDASAPLPGVFYDTTVYQVTVTVTDNGYGSLVATTQIATSEGLAADQLVFENFYHEIPDTGDHSGLEILLALCLTSLTALLALVLLSRRKAHA